MSFPAAIRALEDGDRDGFEVAIMPGGIVGQETRGNEDFVANSTLPIECDHNILRSMGITVGEPVDDLFMDVQLPNGWKKERGEDHRGSYLLDDKGRKRASIFYKAAYYDRYASISILRRYGISVQPVGGWGQEDYKSKEWEATVTDCGKDIWHSEKLRPEPVYHGRPDEADKRQGWLDWQDEKKALGELAGAWLDEHKPDWRDVLAYWDEE